MIEGQRKGVLLIGTWLSGYVQGPVRKQREETGDVGPAKCQERDHTDAESLLGAAFAFDHVGGCRLCWAHGP